MSGSDEPIYIRLHSYAMETISDPTRFARRSIPAALNLYKISESGSEGLGEVFTRGTPTALFSGPLMLACNTTSDAQFYALTKGEDASGYKAIDPKLPQVSTIAWANAAFALTVDSTVYVYGSSPPSLLCSHTFPKSDFKTTFLGSTLFVTCGECIYAMLSLGSGECEIILIRDLGYEGAEVLGLQGR